VVVKGSPEVRVFLSDLAKLDTRGELQALHESVPDPALCISDRMISCLYPAFHYPSFHCHAAEVEVDPGTGQVTVHRYAAAHDIGFAVNPTLIQGQIHGGVVQGIGMGLMEEILYQDGYRTNVNWTDYKLPTIVDVPDIEAIIVEHGIPGGGPYGLKGLGESPVIEPPAALANAVARAAGVRLRSLPMTPEKVLKAIRAKGSPAGQV
jgi:CO/xanthine dehydrogenase Mo-binding subunit